MRQRLSLFRLFLSRLPAALPWTRLRAALLAVLPAVLLAAPHPAFGEAREFGPAFARFTVDVPGGWTVQEQEAGVRIASPDGASFLQASAFRTGAMQPLQVARIYAGLAGTGAPEPADFAGFVLKGPGGLATRLEIARGACLAVACSGDAPELAAMARSARRAP